MRTRRQYQRRSRSGPGLRGTVHWSTGWLRSPAVRCAVLDAPLLTCRTQDWAPPVGRYRTSYPVRVWPWRAGSSQSTTRRPSSDHTWGAEGTSGIAGLGDTAGVSVVPDFGIPTGTGMGCPTPRTLGSRFKGLFTFSGAKRPSSLGSRKRRVFRGMSGTSPSTRIRPEPNCSKSATMYASSVSGSGSFHPRYSSPNARIRRLVMSMATMGIPYGWVSMKAKNGWTGTAPAHACGRSSRSDLL